MGYKKIPGTPGFVINEDTGALLVDLAAGLVKVDLATVDVTALVAGIANGKTQADLDTQLAAILVKLASLLACQVSGMPESGEDLVGAANDDYTTVVTAPARECHFLHVAVGNGGARISLDGGANVHYRVPANTERPFWGLKIAGGANIQAKKLVDGGTQYTNCFISVW